MLAKPRAPMLLALAALLAAPTTLPAQQSSGPSARTLTAAAPRPFEAMSRALLTGRDRLLGGAARDSLVVAARSQLGLRYRLGALAPGLAFDCSGLVQWALGLLDIAVPRTAAQQAQTGIELPKDPGRLLPGDLLYFGRGKRVTHIGIYVGEGRYVHAANRRNGIIESPVPAPTSKWWHGARRVIPTPLDDLDALFEGVTPVTTAGIPVVRTPIL